MNAQDTRIRAIFYQAMRLCDSHGGGSRLLGEAEAIAAKQERRHRAFGRRLVGNIGARASVATCAQYFALKGFLTPTRERQGGEAMTTFACPSADARPCGAPVDNDGEYCEACARRALLAPWGVSENPADEYEPDSDPRKGEL